MIEGRPRPNRMRVRLHEANCAPDYVQAYLADEMDEYLDMLRAESAKTVPMESGWLIETKSQPPLWWNGRPKRDGDCAWGTANQAIRFVRKADAELCLLAQGYSLAHNHAIEHGWG